jgi:hypothetical protein
MRQVQAQRFLKANPKLKIGTHVVGTADPPKVDFEFIDGTKVSLIASFCSSFISMLSMNSCSKQEYNHTSLIEEII